tara:strand:+ start:207 stop:662 length:456 start_codon:yes stop_codon:yes gene_type:complete
MYDYKVKIVRVVDGDTVDVDIDLGFGIWMLKERVRMMGIDTPESRTRDKVEKKFGLAAKKHLKEMLGKTAILRTQIDRSGEDKKGKFGRILGDFDVQVEPSIGQYDTMKSACQIMIDDGHAVSYFGGNKEENKAQHLKNRERLIAEGVVVL